MAKAKADQKELISINRTANYSDHTIILAGIDEKRTKEFNQGKVIEITPEELKAIGEHRWLEVK